MSLVVGLTGGIGSGKSTVAQIFAKFGAPVIDTDVIARELVHPGGPALRAIATKFGQDLIATDGTLRRDLLRARIFSDSSKRAQLEGLLHPLIRSQVVQALKSVSAPYCILVVPLLIERNWSDLVDRILVVDAPESAQIARTIERDGLTAEEVRAIMHAQANRRDRLEQATEVISNEGDTAYLADQVRELHEKYQSIGTALH